jgi:hypothetical protein
MWSSLIGSLIGWAIAAPIIVHWVRRPNKWREMARTEFFSPVDPYEARSRVLALARSHRGWSAIDRPSDLWTVQIRGRMTLASWAKQITVYINEWPTGQVGIVCVSTAPQLFDWGDGQRAISRVHRALGADTTRR